LSLSLPKPIVSVQDLTHIYYPGTSLEKKALAGISFEICEGECVAIVGETGSGKTTLVQHLNGLLKPDLGRVLVESVDISQSPVSLADLRRRVGLVFQYPEHQLFEETVGDDISFVLRQNSTLPPIEIMARVKNACASVGLDYERFHRRSPFELSSGEMRRVALAGVLAQDPKILILDEPTVGLDPEGTREILMEIGDLRRAGKTVIVVSHRVEDLLPLMDRLIVLDRGKICVGGTPIEVFSFLLREKKFLFLVPPIFQLMAELREEGWDIPGEAVCTEEALLALQKNLPSPVRR
jgi:energy-coupling factor transport system ATP-binding protein